MAELKKQVAGRKRRRKTEACKSHPILLSAESVTIHNSTFPSWFLPFQAWKSHVWVQGSDGLQHRHTWMQMCTPKPRYFIVHSRFCVHKGTVMMEERKKGLNEVFESNKQKYPYKINRNRLHPSLQWASTAWIFLIQLYQAVPSTPAVHSLTRI